MDTYTEQKTATVIRRPRIVDHTKLTVHTIIFGDQVYEKSDDETVFKECTVIKASEENLKNAIQKIGIEEICKEKSIKIISRKFWKELTSEGAELGFHHESKTFYKIIAV